MDATGVGQEVKVWKRQYPYGSIVCVRSEGMISALASPVTAWHPFVFASLQSYGKGP